MAALWEPSPPNSVENDWPADSVQERIHTLVLAVTAAKLGGGGIASALLLVDLFMK